MIEADCPTCHHRYQLRDTYAGKRFNCKNCAGVVSVPDAIPEQPKVRTEVQAPSPDPPTPDSPSGKPSMRVTIVGFNIPFWHLFDIVFQVVVAVVGSVIAVAIVLLAIAAFFAFLITAIGGFR